MKIVLFIVMYYKIISNLFSCKYMYFVFFIIVYVYFFFNGKCFVIICIISLKEEEFLILEIN